MPGTRDICRVGQQPDAGALQAELLLVLNRAHRRGGAEVPVERRDAQAYLGGQVLDTCHPEEAKLGTAGDLPKLQQIHRMKTGALIRCSCRMGAISAGATPAQLEAITDYADAVGLMFQVVDDLLDVTQTTEHLGKAANKDADSCLVAGKTRTVRRSCRP